MLAAAEKVAGAPELQVLLGDAEAVVRLGQGFQPPFRVVILHVAEQNTVALGLAAAHPAAQLVQLTQAEAVGVLHHHQRGVGHIHAHLHHGGGDQDIALTGGEGGHDLFLLLWLHTAVEHGYPQLGEGILLQCLGVGRHGLALIGQSVILAHQRADDEHLMALLHLLADKAVEPRPVFLAQSEGLHCLPSRRQLVDHGYIQGMQGPLLGYLYHKSRNGDVYQKDVEKEFRIRRSTATVMLQNLEQKGYIVRVASTEDARLKRILLTEKAIEHHNLIEEQIRDFNRELENGITEEEKQTFLTILDKMMQNLGQDSRRTGRCNGPCRNE